MIYQCSYCKVKFKKLKKPLYNHFEKKHNGEKIMLNKI
jgi:protein-disulfide isomerase